MPSYVYTPPEYTPYRIVSSIIEESVIINVGEGKEQMLARLKYLLDFINGETTAIRNYMHGLSLINTGRDPRLSEALDGVWDEGTAMPLTIYEPLATSQVAKHKYIADVALSASRGVSGNYALDMLDLFKMVAYEATNVGNWLDEGNVEAIEVVRGAEAVVDALEAVMSYATQVNTYNKINVRNYSAHTNPDPEARAKGIQKELHKSLDMVNKYISKAKSAWMEVTTSSPAFYNKVRSLNATASNRDRQEATRLLQERSAIIDTSSREFLGAISTGASVRESWYGQMEASGLDPQAIAEQATIGNNVGDLNAQKALLSSLGVMNNSMFYTDLVDIFVRRQGYTYEDSLAIVAILNALPPNSTFVRAGLIHVQAEWGFVNDLIDQLNNLPSNSTLITGGAIALTGGESLDEFYDDVVNGVYGAGYQTVQEVIDALNEAHGYFSGLTILQPGVIGLIGDEGIRNAIVDSINDFTGSATLIGAGAVLIAGSDTLADKAILWDADAEGIADLQNTISFWSVFNRTLIDGSKILTGSIGLDMLMSGMTPLLNPAEAIDLSVGENVEIDLGASYYIRELRTAAWVDGICVNEVLTWPFAPDTNDDHIYFKLEVSADNDTWYYIRGGPSSSDYFKRQVYIDTEELLQDTPLFIVADGNYVRYIRFTFMGFYDNDVLQPDEDLTVNLMVYGAQAVLDGGNLMVSSIVVGALEPYVQTTVSNFNTRNDRNDVTPLTPTVPITTEALGHINNTDSSVSLKFKWIY